MDLDGQDEDGRPAPLAGIRVLDFGMAAVGPIAAEYLGWLGADVIKIESPTGDVVRNTHPRLNGTGHTFLGNNLNKRGIVLNLKDAADRETAVRLIRTADVLVENFRSPRIMASFGLGYDEVSRINPRIIYLQATAYGPRGPLHGMLSNEWFSQAAGGFTSVTGQPGGPPEFSRGTATLDWNGAFVNLEGLLIALYVRNRTDRGMLIETSQLQSTMVGATTRIAEYFATGRSPSPMGAGRPNLVPDQAFATADGYVTVTVPHDHFWGRLCDALERPDLRDDPRFATARERVVNREALVSALDDCFRSRGSAEWVAQLSAAGVPCAVPQPPNQTLSANLLTHPQIRAMAMMAVIDTPNGRMATARPHWRFDKTRARITRPSPQHGEHQAEVLRELKERWPAEAASGGGDAAGA